MAATPRKPAAACAAVLLVAGLGPAAGPAAAQSWQCTGLVGGVPSQSVIQFERTPDTTFVSGAIENEYAAYTFTGEMYGGNEGFILLTDTITGERIDRVYIVVTAGGYAIRPEGSEAYGFTCQ